LGVEAWTRARGRGGGLNRNRTRRHRLFSAPRRARYEPNGWTLACDTQLHARNGCT